MAINRRGSRVRADNPRAALRTAPVVRILRVPAWATLLLLVTSACASSDNPLPLGAAGADLALYELGMEALEERRWLPAREYFAAVVDNYPQSVVRPDAMLGIGDTYYGEGSVATYLQAINEFEQFLSFFPLHLRADYAQYKLGMAHYDQMRRADMVHMNRHTGACELPCAARMVEMDVREQQRGDVTGGHVQRTKPTTQHLPGRCRPGLHDHPASRSLDHP